MVEVDEMPRCAVQNEAKELLEEARHRQALAALSHRADEAIEVLHQVQTA